MPKRGALAMALTTLALVLLLNFQTPGAASTLEPVARSGSSSTTGSSTTSDATAAPAASATVDGPTVGTRYGPVQVEVTIESGQITDVTALQLPTGGRSGQISREVESMLNSQALTAQSANIDGVSGATYTSDAYARSLQAALDDAGFTG